MDIDQKMKEFRDGFLPEVMNPTLNGKWEKYTNQWIEKFESFLKTALEEQEACLRLSEEEVGAKIFTIMMSDEKYMSLPDSYVKEIAWKAIVVLQGKDKE